MIADLEELNSTIKSEADGILYENGLMHVLNKFGKALVSGSYFLELMTWRDLDIYLANDEMDVNSFFELGKELALCIKPSKMNYRNELIGHTEHLPLGYYWGCYTFIYSNDWKVDVWVISSEDFARRELEIHELKSKIDVMQRKAILKLKNRLYSHPLYRKKFFSVDIYNAVIEDSIYNEDDFTNWLLHNFSEPQAQQGY